MSGNDKVGNGMKSDDVDISLIYLTRETTSLAIIHRPLIPSAQIVHLQFGHPLLLIRYGLHSTTVSANSFTTVRFLCPANFNLVTLLVIVFGDL